MSQEEQLKKYEQRALQVATDLLPGQRWAHDDVSVILMRALAHVHKPGLQPEPQVESFFIVGPSGTGKTQFCSNLSGELNASNASYYHRIAAQSVSSTPGRTVEKDLAGKIQGWEQTHAAALKKDPSLPSPIAVVLIDEFDHASAKLCESFRDMLEHKQIVLPPLKKGQRPRTVRFPPGWAFLFIFAPNKAGDLFLTVQPGEPRPAADPSDNCSDASNETEAYHCKLTESE